MNAFEIKPGQIWETRNGKQVIIDNIIESDPHPVKSGEILSWQLNGRFWGDDFEHKYDLIIKLAHVS